MISAEVLQVDNGKRSTWRGTSTPSSLEHSMTTAILAEKKMKQDAYAHFPIRSGIQPHDADLDIHDLRRSINEELDFKARVGERYGIALR